MATKKKAQTSRRRKLSPAQVCAIRKAVMKGISYRPLAERFGTNPASISMIVNGKTYKEVVCK